MPPTRTPVRERTAAATETRQQIFAERAASDPVKLAKAARIFRAALAKGLVDRDGNVLAASR